MVPTSGVLSPICCSLVFCWLVSADQPLLSVAQWLNAFLLTDLSELLLAALDVAVLLDFPGASPHLRFAFLLRLEMVTLLLDWEGENIGELLQIPVYNSLARLSLSFSGCCRNSGSTA